MAIVLIATLLSTTVHALTTFDTNCTIPSDQVNYVSSPNTRGTLTILWACLFTILSCTWTVQNPDVPWQRENYEPGPKGARKHTIQKYTTQAVWFVVTVLAPEVLLGKYWLDNKKADEELGDLQKYAQEDGVEWTKTHSLFANMGGFAIRINLAQRRPEALVSPEPENKAENGTNCEEEHPNSRPASGSEESRSPVNHTTDEESGVSSPQQQKYTYFYSASDILKLRSEGGLPRMPDITKKELHDRSKADGLMRLITVVQIMWMCIQVITRAVRGLTVSQLEISVTAFASCAVVMYWLSWDKPKGVMVPITIVQYGDEGRALVNMLGQKFPPPIVVDHGQGWWFWMHEFLGKSLGTIFGEHVHIGFGIALGGLLFGGIHLIAWNFAFPTATEGLLWRIAALYCACFPIGYVIICSSFYIAFDNVCSLSRLLDGLESLFMTVYLHEFPFPMYQFFLRVIPSDGTFFSLVLAPGITLYILARVYLLVEMFRTLAYLPTDAYIGTWMVNIPYLG